MASPLSDLDELVLKCRDEKAKSYIKESVSCYKSGAFRSAIVSTWIAVSLDIIDKLKSLSIAGDREAEVQLEIFENARRDGDIAKFLRFEKAILKIARDKLELISYIEFIDLERLQEDRNRCAHPSMTSDGEIFNPSAELARVHIRTAVEYLLQYPPAQGKYALESLLKEVKSEYFPTSKNQAVIALKNSPLLNARESLVRGFISVLLKQILKETGDYKEGMRASSALNAVSQMHKIIYDSTLKDNLSKLFKLLDDGDLNKTFYVLKELPDSWEYLDPDVKQKLKIYVESLPAEHFKEVEFLLTHTGLSASAQMRIKTATRSDLECLSFFDLPAPVADRIVSLFTQSISYDQANSLSSTVIQHAPNFSKEQVEMIIRACGENSQIKDCFQVGFVINSMRKNKNVADAEIDAWLIDVGLKVYTKPEHTE